MEHIYTPKQDYKVLVRCFTYNQSKYIEDALNGFVMQQTSFPFVCLVMDDCSTDGEQEVIKAWMERECDMDKAEYIEIELSQIILVPHKSNTNCTFAFYFLRQNLYGTGDKKMCMVYPWREHCEYEALCEGDDYWTYIDKLQKQIVFLDNNPNYTCCLTRYVCYDQNKKSIYAVCGESRKDTRDMLEHDFQFGTCTIVLRTALLKKYYEEVQPYKKDWLMGDKPLILFLGAKGFVHTIKECMATYRILDNTASHSQNIILQLKRARNTIDIYHYFADKYYYGDKKLADTIEGGYIYRAYLIYKSSNQNLSNEIISQIKKYRGGYWKLYIVKLLIQFKWLHNIVYSLSSIKNKLFTIIRKQHV